MGIQVLIGINGLKEAGCTVDITEKYTEFNDQMFNDSHADVTFPDGTRYAFYVSETLESLWIDFNHWGSNRPKIEPLLIKYNIPYQEF
jgi:hypothetical protein